MSYSPIEVRGRLGIRPGRMFIGGAWIDWDGSRFDQANPCTNEVMTSFAEAGQRGVDMAVAAARKAFDEGPWPRMPAQDRKRLLQRIVERFYGDEELLVQLQTLDNGIPHHFARNTRVSATTAADIFDHCLGWIDNTNVKTYPPPNWSKRRSKPSRRKRPAVFAGKYRSASGSNHDATM